MQEGARIAIDDRDEIKRLKEDVGDLEKEIREKDRVVEAKDEAMVNDDRNPLGYFANRYQERLQEKTRKALEDLDEVGIWFNGQEWTPQLISIIATAGDGKQILQH